jgi:AraC-like DNA-binding protein
MIHFSYSDKSYLTFYPKFAEKVSSTFQYNSILINPATGKGKLELIPLGDGIYASISNYELNIDFKFCRKKVEDPFFILHFDEMRSNKIFALELDGEMIKAKGHVLSVAMLSCSLFDLCYFLPANTHKRAVSIILTKEWIKKYMNMGIDEEGICQTFFNLKLQHLTHESFNTLYRSYFDQIFETPDDRPLRNLHIRNAVMMLIETYFSRLYKKQNSIQDSVIKKIPAIDLYKLMEVESILVKDFSKTPPTIVDLAQYTQISISKLKSTFKKVYGSGIYEYYQKNRMRKAHTMLSTNRYSVKEVGTKLGYSNLSNFSLAFKKEFGVLPSQL